MDDRGARDAHGEAGMPPFPPARAGGAWTGLTMGSLFSGSGGFELAALRAGIMPVWASEVEPFAVMVTRRRMPWLRHAGDITRLSGGSLEPVDVITGGSPCQDLSVAGRRAGLSGERSGLFMEMMRVISEMKEATGGRSPRYIVWENVPGAFSSGGGRDFRRVLEGFTRLFDPEGVVPMPEHGRWLGAGQVVGYGHGSLAWRTLDAQYWGVPQRRRRVFLVVDTLGGRAPEVLFESEGLRGDPEEGGAARQGASAGAGGGALPAVGGRDGSLTGICADDVPSAPGARGGSGTLRAQAKGHSPVVLDGEAAEGKAPPVCLCHHSYGMMEALDDMTATLGVAGDPPVVLDHHPQAGRIGFARGGAAQTLPGNMGTGGNNTPMVLCPGTAAPLQARETSGPPFLDNQSLFGTEPQLICVPGGTGQDGGATLSGKDVFGTNTVSQGEKLWLGNQDAFSGDYFIRGDSWQVRRITPTECARLQGFPDGWARGLGLAEEDITGEEMSFWRGVFSQAGKKRTDAAIRKWLRDPHTDAAEYRLWGNGVALPCAEYVMRGIAGGGRGA